MKTLKSIAWFLGWMILAAAVCALTSTYFFRSSGDILFTAGPAEFHAAGFGAGLGFLTMVLTGNLYCHDRKKRNRERNSFGLMLQGAGFGLLPAAAVWNAFLHYDRMGQGAEIIPPMPALPWLTENGTYCPARIDLCAAVICFLAINLWLILRKRDLGRKGDLLMVSGTVWAAIRIATESFHGDNRQMPWGHPVLRYAGCMVILICLAIWTGRREKKSKTAVQLILDWIAVLIGTAAIVITSEGILSTGSAIGDFAVLSGAAALIMTVTLTAGGDSRA
jgi:hypothetical protein